MLKLQRKPNRAAQYLWLGRMRPVGWTQLADLHQRFIFTMGNNAAEEEKIENLDNRFGGYTAFRVASRKEQAEARESVGGAAESHLKVPSIQARGYVSTRPSSCCKQRGHLQLVWRKDVERENSRTNVNRSQRLSRRTNISTAQAMNRDSSGKTKQLSIKGVNGGGDLLLKGSLKTSRSPTMAWCRPPRNR